MMEDQLAIIESMIIDLTSEDDTSTAEAISDLGVLLLARFELSGNLADIDDAVSAQQQAVQLTPEDHTNKAEYLDSLGTSLLVRFQRLGDLADLDGAISAQQQAVELTPSEHIDKSGYQNNLGSSFLRRFERLGELRDLNSAVDAQRQAVKLAPNRPGYLDSLGTSLMRQFERLGDLRDLNNAIEVKQEAVNLTPEGHADKPGYLSNLGGSFLIRFGRLAEMVDIDSAIHVQQQAVDLTPKTQADHAMYLTNLGNSFQIRFLRLGRSEDIDSAIHVQRQAVELTPEGHSNKPGCLNNLGHSFRARFGRLGELADVNSAISAQRQAVELTPQGHASKPGRLNSLGNSLMNRFERLGELVDIDSAIGMQRQAVDLAPDDHAEKPRCLNGLGNSFLSRFERLGELADIDTAIHMQRQAVELTPKDHIDKPGRLNNLGISFKVRFERYGGLTDINNAIDMQQQAVSISPEDHANNATYLNNLGNSFFTRFERSRKPVDIDSAIRMQRQSIEITPNDHADKPGYLNNLGISFRFRFEQLGALADIDNAINVQRQAVELLPQGHASKATCLNSLGHSLLSRFQRLEEMADFRAVADICKTVINDLSGPASRRFSAALRWAWLLSSKHSTSSRLEAHRAVIELIPRVAWLGFKLHRRYEELPSIAKAVSAAAAAAIAAGDPACALEWLEEGRSIVWGQMLQLRTPLDDLRGVDPKVADELELVSRELENAGMVRENIGVGELDRQVSPEDAAQRHRRLADRYDELIKQANMLPGCENFLQPKKLAHLHRAANSGPVVVINIDVKRCDALVLRPECVGTVLHIALPTFSYEDATHWQRLMLQSLQMLGLWARGSRFRAAGHDKMSPILAKLWWNVVHPILFRLKLLEQNTQHDHTPHITWCTTGPLAFLPIHAAGIYDRQGPKIFSHVVSSYTPTLTALLKARRHRYLPNSIPSVLAVSQPATPGQNALPGTVVEVAAVQKCIGDLGFHRLTGEEATKDAVLESMAVHSWIHLACHAEQHTGDDPTKSAFILHNGGLELLDIMKKSFRHTELAVLSSCQTATGAEKLPEEAVHLAAGMLIAGYRSVVATMWSIKDNDAPIVMEELYSRLTKEGCDDDRKVAYALHDAVKCLRDRVGENEFVRWVPFIHIGI